MTGAKRTEKQQDRDHDPSASALMVLDLALELRRRAKVFASSGDAKRAKSLYDSCREQLENAEGHLRFGRQLRKLVDKVLDAWRRAEEQESGDLADLVECQKELGNCVAELEVAVAEALVESGISTTTPGHTAPPSSHSTPRPPEIFQPIEEVHGKPSSSATAVSTVAASSIRSSSSTSSSSSGQRSRISADGLVPLERATDRPDAPLSTLPSSPRGALRLLDLADAWPTLLSKKEVRKRYKEAKGTPGREPRKQLKAAYAVLKAALKIVPVAPSVNGSHAKPPDPPTMLLAVSPPAAAAVLSGPRAAAQEVPLYQNVFSSGSYGVNRQRPFKRPGNRKPWICCLFPAGGSRVVKGATTAGPGQGEQLRLARDFQRGAMVGAGSFGCVFAARHVVTGEIVAVKEMFLDRGTVSNEARGAGLVRLTRELRLCETLVHPRIVRYMGHEFVIGAQGGPERVYLFLEYCSGGSLAAQLRTYGALTEVLLRKYTGQLVEGLIYLHSLTPPVVHRDLKCANLLLTHSADVKITDFGCSKWLSGTDAILEAEHSVVGSVFWMAPELLRGKPRLATCSDVWSLGCCVLEMATGHPPWSEKKFDNILQACHVIAESSELPTLPNDFSEQAQLFVKACLRRNPVERLTAYELGAHALLAGSSALRLTRHSGGVASEFHNGTDRAAERNSV